MKPKIEICCGSAQDCQAAQRGGADRIELNSALALGGLTPTLANLIEAKKTVTLPIITMVRSRGAGFCTTDAEFEILFADAELLLKHGADGLAFGAPNADHTLNAAQTRAMIELAHRYGREFVFHRAFDCAADFDTAISQLIDWKADRVLTSGGEDKAEHGIETLARLQRKYGGHIEILAGSGVNASNARLLLEQTGVHQLHSSCKDWLTDPTTVGHHVTYAFAPAPHELDYDVVSEQKVRELTAAVGVCG